MKKIGECNLKSWSFSPVPLLKLTTHILTIHNILNRICAKTVKINNMHKIIQLNRMQFGFPVTRKKSRKQESIVYSQMHNSFGKNLSKLCTRRLDTEHVSEKIAFNHHMQSNRWIYIHTTDPRRNYANVWKYQTYRIREPKIQRSRTKRRLDFNRVEAETGHITLSRYNNNKTIKIENFTRTFLGRIVSHHKRLTTTRNRPLTLGRIESDSKNVEASGEKAFLVKNRTKDALQHTIEYLEI